MGMTSALGRLASRSLHVLLVETPGAFELRAAVERSCRERGWPLAVSPTDADVVLICGRDGDALGEAVDAVWRQVPGPRARGEIRSPSEVEATLDRLAAVVTGWRPEQDPIADIGAGRANDAGNGHDDHHAPDDGTDDHTDDESDEEMDMSGPGGIPLASGAEDRDGLEMDQLHLRLGPVLPCWPAGLAVWCSLQGDVVTEIEVETAPVGQVSPHPSVAAAVRLDAAGQLLRLAGADDLATAAHRARDVLLADPTGPESELESESESANLTASLRRRVERAWILRWSLRGLGVVEQVDAADHGWSPIWVGDVWDRLLRLLEPMTEPFTPVQLDEVAAALPLLLPGRELATARLVVASLVAQQAAYADVQALGTGA
ncbi:MAG: hypothetical protein L0H41_04655 [Microlunatus sp.]|nr:hypothetical protein [Microlunatus sp.]